MAKSTTDMLLTQLNKMRGLSYPQIGYSYYADIKGDGQNIRSVYTIINADGGVTYSDLNADTPAKRCMRIREAITAEARARGLNLGKED